MKNLTIANTKKELGETLKIQIKMQGSIADFAKEAGINRATLYHLIQGKNVSTDILLRTLRTLNRFDLIEQLIAPPEDSPIHKLQKVSSFQKPKTRQGPQFEFITLPTGKSKED